MFLKIKIFPSEVSKLKKEMKKSPRFYKTIKSNKAPIILDKSLGLKVDPYKKIGINLLTRRAELMKSNEKFSITFILWVTNNLVPTKSIGTYV